jgi:3-deoxy-D-arabino-heptulosonate 7-phosphate (DAHP) synthase
LAATSSLAALLGGSEKQIMDTAEELRGARVRGGAFRRTSPYDFQGMELEGLKLLRKAKERTGLGIITEIMAIATWRWWPSTPTVCRWALGICKTSRC